MNLDWRKDLKQCLVILNKIKMGTCPGQFVTTEHFRYNHIQGLIHELLREWDKDTEKLAKGGTECVCVAANMFGIVTTKCEICGKVWLP